MTLYGYISILYVCLPVCLCLLQCIMDPPSLTYPLPAEDEVGYIYLPVCLCVCLSVCVTGPYRPLSDLSFMSVCLIVLHDLMDPVTQWPTFSLLWMRQVMLCNTCWVSGEYCSPTLTSLISPFWGQEGGGGDLDIFGASCSSLVYDMILSTDVIYNYFRKQTHYIRIQKNWNITLDM